MIRVDEHPEGAVVPVRAKPSSRVDAILGGHGGALRVGVSAAPERGRANEAIARLLADRLGLRSSQVELLTGPTNRDKRFLIRGLDPSEVLERLNAHIEIHQAESYE